MSHIGDGSGGIFSKSAAAASAAAADDGGLPLRVLVCNAQDWKYGANESAVSQARGAALMGMLRQLDPHVVVLLETGEAGKENEHIARYAKAAGSPFGIAYSAPVLLPRDAMTTDHDKSAVIFRRADVAVTGCTFYPIASGSERRPMIIRDAEAPSSV